jgi:integrase
MRVLPDWLRWCRRWCGRYGRSHSLCEFSRHKREAQNELARIISQVTNGIFVDPTKATLADYLKDWIGQAEDKRSISPKTAERYRGLIENQINPYLGSVLLQKLRPSHIAAWHATLLSGGRHDGGALSARSILGSWAKR